MIWGAFTVHDYTPLYIVQGDTLNSQRYIHLLQDALQPNLPTLLPNSGLLQQDNAPAHASRATKKNIWSTMLYASSLGLAQAQI